RGGADGVDDHVGPRVGLLAPLPKRRRVVIAVPFLHHRQSDGWTHHPGGMVSRRRAGNEEVLPVVPAMTKWVAKPSASRPGYSTHNGWGGMQPRGPWAKKLTKIPGGHP